MAHRARPGFTQTLNTSSQSFVAHFVEFFNREAGFICVDLGDLWVTRGAGWRKAFVDGPQMTQMAVDGEKGSGSGIPDVRNLRRKGI